MIKLWSTVGLDVIIKSTPWIAI